MTSGRSPVRLVGLLVAGLAWPAAGQEPVSSVGTDLSVYLITMGPGQYVWERYGHNALWVRDNRTGSGRAYNYGIFSFQQENFFVRFVQGRPEYWMQGFEVQSHLQYYQEQNRSLWVQELNLTPEQRVEIRDFLEWNELPENRYYRYDPYLDNCSTRIRDLIDRVLGGRLRDLTDREETEATFRHHSLRLVADHIPTYVGLSLALGQPSDQRLTAWEEMFIPLEMREYLRDITVVGPDGREEPLVLSERTLFESSASYGREAPPRWLVVFLGAGLLVAGLIVVPMLLAVRPAARVAATAAAVFWLLALGVAGVTMLGLWGFTNHWIAYRNENLFFANPVALVLAFTLPFAARGGRGASRVSLWLAGVMVALSLLGFMLQILPWFDQVNGSIIALALPPNLALGWVVWRLATGAHRRASPTGSTDDPPETAP